VTEFPRSGVIAFDAQRRRDSGRAEREAEEQS